MKNSGNREPGTGSREQGAGGREKIFFSTAAFALCLMTVLSVVPALAAKKKKSKISEKKATLHSIRKEITKTKGILHDIKVKEKVLSKELETTEKQLSQTKQKLETVSTSLRKTQLQKEMVSKKLEETKKTFESERGDFEKRIVQIYKYGPLRYWEVLLGATSFWDLLTRVRFLRLIIASDVDLLEKIQRTKHRIAKKEKELHKKVQEISSLKKEVGKQQVAYASQKDRQTQILKDVREKKSAYMQYLAELEQTSNEIESWIRKAEAEQKLKPQHYTYSFKGKWLRPVPGRITSGFGYRRHPVFKISKLHTGIDFAAPMGTPVHAAAGGIVYFAGWWGGYGNVVILDHGGGWATVYAHNSSFAVSAGQSVQAGQVISYSGSTGLSTGPHVHFEVRKNGVPINPLR